MLTLDKLSFGEKATITRISADKKLRRRLLEMGVTRGTTVEMIKVSPLGDPIEYKLRHYHLSLRKLEAQGIEIEF